jgi:hypothetical protein
METRAVRWLFQERNHVMNLLDTIMSAENGAAVRQIGSQLGLGPEQTSSALAVLVPALAAGFQRNTQTPGGLDSLLSALTKGGHARYVDDPSMLAGPDAIADGNGILGHIFGSKDVSRQVARTAAARTGVGEEVLKRMLPMAAALMMGTFARQGAALTPGQGSAPTKPGGGIMDLLGATLDRNRDGSLVDDVMGMLGGLVGR